MNNQNSHSIKSKNIQSKKKSKKKSSKKKTNNEKENHENSVSSISDVMGMSTSLLSPPFLERLRGSEVKTILLVGTGGGFDFCHSMLIFPELLRMGKRIVIGSYSFGSIDAFEDGEVFFSEGEANSSLKALKVTAKTKTLNDRYKPEIGLMSYLDSVLPDQSPNYCYAYYARAWGVGSLTRLYKKLIEEEKIDCIMCIDGGSDSLMKGDEQGLGDPIEDAVTVETVAKLTTTGALKTSVLLSVGLGADRFNQVSDGSSLRAIAELTAIGGFLGVFSSVQGTLCFEFYKNAIEHIYNQQSFRSVLSSFILASGQGLYGHVIPPLSGGRVKSPERVFVWPLMSIVFAFDPVVVANRSLVCQAVGAADTALDGQQKFSVVREILALEKKIRPVENLPSHQSMTLIHSFITKNYYYYLKLR